MTTTHPTTVRNALADLVVDLIDQGTANAAGQIEIQTSGDVEVASLPFSVPPAFGDAAAGVATANAITDDGNATGGTAAKFEFQDRDVSTVLLGSVTATGGGGDLELSTVTIPANGTVQITSFTYTAPD